VHQAKILQIWLLHQSKFREKIKQTKQKKTNRFSLLQTPTLAVKPRWIGKGKLQEICYLNQNAGYSIETKGHKTPGRLCFHRHLWE
jgi:hypothetical protein